jgi:hypothetical protein
MTLAENELDKGDKQMPASKYGDGVDQHDLPFFSKGEVRGGPDDSLESDGPINAGAWAIHGEPDYAPKYPGQDRSGSGWPPATK